ncbi:MAG TPA: class I SAM-dependent methyltransferase [Ignavibacteria bacterium]|nr:class I SAM-dependent methyltransferase [Ignavibacteria bacterium]
MDSSTDDKYEIIDGVRCYAPSLARGNNDFDASSFEKLYSLEEKNFWFRTRNKIIKRLAGKYFGKERGGKFLEIGCGTGYVLKGLEEFERLELYGAEIYLEGLKYAKKRLPEVEFVQLDATEMPYRDEFECIGAFDVLEHIEKDEAAIKSIHGSLKDGGLFFISVPQYKFMWSYLDDVACHKRRYSSKELRTKLINAGFTVLYSSSFVFSLFPLMLLSRLIKGKKPEWTVNSEETFQELDLNPILNCIFTAALSIDTFLIGAGVRLPFGGSIIMVAEKRRG